MTALASLTIATAAHAQSITLDSEWEKKAAAEKAANEKAEREKQLKAKADEEAAIKKYNEKLAAEESKKTYAEKHPNMFSKEGDKDMEETERRNQKEADKSLPYIQKEYPCIIFPAYRGKIELQSNGVQWQMFVTGGGRYCNVWAMYPEQYKNWKESGEPQPYTPEYTTWCKANPQRYRK